MKIEIINIDEIQIAEIISDKIVIENIDDFMNIIRYSYSSDISNIIIFEKSISPDFFNLKNGLAGEIFQKCSNYQINMAIIGDFSKFNSKPLNDLIYECNKSGNIVFLENNEQAIKKLLSLTK